MDRTAIGWIGTGVMGSSMCRHLLDAGHVVTLTTRTREKAASLVDAGARWAETPAEVAASADVTFSIVGYPSDVREVALGAGGVLAGARAGSVYVDMTTSEPSLAVEMEAAGAERGIAVLDAPVSGGDVGARNGTLSIMVGGDADAFARVYPLLQTLGSTIVLQGPAGAGQHTKMVNQILIASGMIGVAEAFVYGARAGLDLDSVLESVGGGAAGSWSLSNYGPRMLAGDMEPGFYVEHFVKDMGIAAAEAASMGVATPGLELALRLYGELSAAGGGRAGTQALVRALAEMSGADWDELRRQSPS